MDAIHCDVCGVVAPGPSGSAPLTWVAEAGAGADAGGVRRVCESCARTHLRAIEAKLDQAWW